MDLEKRGVATRLIFAGNITKHGLMKDVDFCAPFGLQHSDDVMRHAFSVGLNQTVTEEEAHFIAKEVRECLVTNA